MTGAPLTKERQKSLQIYLIEIVFEIGDFSRKWRPKGKNGHCIIFFMLVFLMMLKQTLFTVSHNERFRGTVKGSLHARREAGLSFCCASFNEEVDSHGEVWWIKEARSRGVNEGWGEDLARPVCLDFSLWPCISRIRIFLSSRCRRTSLRWGF